MHFFILDSSYLRNTVCFFLQLLLPRRWSFIARHGLYLGLLSINFSCQSELNGNQLFNITYHEEVSRVPISYSLLGVADRDDILYQTYLVEYENAEAVYYANYVDIVFEPLTQEQFHLILSRYGYGTSKVKWDPETRYRLQDFLTPVMQAMSGKSFKWQVTNARNLVAQNCWNVVYEVLRHSELESSFYEVYAASSESVLGVFSDPNLFGQVSLNSDFESISLGLRNPQLRFGDVLLDVEDEQLFHAALFVDHDLLFQKANPAEESLVGLQLVNDEFYKPEFLHSVRFVRRNNHNSLPPPIEVFRGYMENDMLISEDENEFIDSDDMLATFRVNFKLNESGRPTIVN